MGEDVADRHLLLAFVVPEVLLGGWLAVLLGLSLAGSGSFLATYSVAVRATLFTLVVLEVAIPLFVAVDGRRRPDDPDSVWVHAAAMPVVNLFGIVAYLEDRKRSLEG